MGPGGHKHSVTYGSAHTHTRVCAHARTRMHAHTQRLRSRTKPGPHSATWNGEMRLMMMGVEVVVVGLTVGVVKDACPIR